MTVCELELLYAKNYKRSTNVIDLLPKQRSFTTVEAFHGALLPPLPPQYGISWIKNRSFHVQQFVWHCEFGLSRTQGFLRNTFGGIQSPRRVVEQNETEFDDPVAESSQKEALDSFFIIMQMQNTDVL